MKNFPAFILLVFLFAVSCTKKNDTTPQTPGTPNSQPPLTFTVINKPETHRLLKFVSNAASGSTFQWNFGDGVSSSEPGPTHTYNITGSYTITLVVNNDTAHRAILILPVTSMAHEMAGVYTNAGQIIGPNSTPFFNDHGTINYLSDTTSKKIIVQDITDSTVQLIDTFYNSYSYQQYTLKLVDSLTTDSTLTYRSGFSVTLKHYFLSNHLYFDAAISGMAGGWFVESYKLK